MRKIFNHEPSPFIDGPVKVEAVDEPGHGGANHAYVASYYQDGDEKLLLPLAFQNGPVKEAGVNGVTEAVLLAIIIDRLRAFQASIYKCRENAIALTHLEEALMWMHKRTHDRVHRGVEGTLQR